MAYINYCFAHDDVPALEGAGADVTQIEIADLAEYEGGDSCPTAVVVGAHGCNGDSCNLELFDAAPTPGQCGDDAGNIVGQTEAIWDPRPVVIFATCYAGYAQGTIAGPVCGVSGCDTIPTSVATQNLLAILHCLANGDTNGDGRVSQTEVDACLDSRLGTPRVAWCSGIDIAVGASCESRARTVSAARPASRRPTPAALCRTRRTRSRPCPAAHRIRGSRAATSRGGARPRTPR